MLIVKCGFCTWKANFFIGVFFKLKDSLEPARYNTNADFSYIYYMLVVLNFVVYAVTKVEMVPQLCFSVLIEV